MLNAAELQPAYILHTRHYRETSLLIEAFTSSQGRISLIAKAARGLHHKNKRYKSLLQAFNPLLLSWRGKTELLNLYQAEPNRRISHQLIGKPLLCGFYLNELLIRLLHRYDPHPSLFESYQHALTHLAHEPEIALRQFEKKLLAEVGYALRLDKDNDSQQDIIADQVYQFVANEGIVRCPKNRPLSESVFSGSSLLAIHHEHWGNKLHLRTAKRLFRLALNHLLEGKNLYSRSLLYPPAQAND